MEVPAMTEERIVRPAGAVGLTVFLIAIVFFTPY
jgi:hypothetical protein